MNIDHEKSCERCIHYGDSVCGPCKNAAFKYINEENQRLNMRIDELIGENSVLRDALELKAKKEREQQKVKMLIEIPESTYELVKMLSNMGDTLNIYELAIRNGTVLSNGKEESDD